MPLMIPPTPIPTCIYTPPEVYQVPKQPVDILTFYYGKDMAYAPATKTYDVRLLFSFVLPHVYVRV
jgi:hypothetical protein